ncbi:hypothetical protein [Jonesia quinghaiensis]|uniref:hypothetical protein n=1 Tax=Jonesia quinghaiensis TaxID=262806 RepID=UPI0004901220|nr:hypothetical protein [Jonesia quinghaiensis]
MTGASRLDLAGNGQPTEGESVETSRSAGTLRSLILGVSSGIIAAAVFIALAGYFALQAEAAQVGLVLDWQNNAASIEPPRTPWLSFAMLAVLGWGVLWVSLVGVGRANKQFQRGAVLAFTVTTVCLVAWAMMSFPLPGDANFELMTLQLGPAMWLENGGALPAVHMLAPVPFVAWLYRRRR